MDISAKQKGQKPLLIVQHESQWAGWDELLPGIPVFLKERPDGAPKWKVDHDKLFLGSQDQKQTFMGSVRRLAKDNACFNQQTVFQYEQWVKDFPAPPDDDQPDPNFVWPTPSST